MEHIHETKSYILKFTKTAYTVENKKDKIVVGHYKLPNESYFNLKKIIKELDKRFENYSPYSLSELVPTLEEMDYMDKNRGKRTNCTGVR